MKVFIYSPDHPFGHPRIAAHALRVEIPHIAPDDRQYKIIILDADDGIDIMLHNPDGSRTFLHTLPQNREEGQP